MSSMSNLKPSALAMSGLVLSLSVFGCSDPVTPVEDVGPRDAPVSPGLDAPVTPGTDAPIDPGTDAPIAPGTDAPVAVDAPVATDAPVVSAADPSAPGPFAVGAPMEDTVRAEGRDTPVAAYVPTSAAPLPLVVFLPGFQLTASQYARTLERIASHGFVVIGADPTTSFFSISHVNMAADTVAVIDWALSGTSGLSSSIDASRIAVMGHSLGGKVSTMVASMDPRITALFTLDPVNGGAGPLGYTAAAPDIVPDLVRALTIPVGFLGETNNAAGGFMPCAPADQNYTTFYDAATGAVWSAEWTLAGADHMDFIDDLAACGFACSACSDGPGDDAVQLAIARTLSVAFLRRHLAGETAMDAWLTGSSVPAGATVRRR